MTNCPIHGLTETVPTSEGWVTIGASDAGPGSNPSAAAEVFPQAEAAFGVGERDNAQAEATALQKLVAEMREALTRANELGVQHAQDGKWSAGEWSEHQLITYNAIRRTPAGIADQWVRKSEVERVEKQRDELKAWKESMLAVESEWDVQALARLLGAPLGRSCRKEISERLPALVKERDDLREKLANAEREREAAVAKAFADGKGTQLILELRGRDKFISDLRNEIKDDRDTLRQEIASLQSDLAAARQSASEAEGLREALEKIAMHPPYYRTIAEEALKALQPAKGEAKSVQASAKITIGPDDNCSGYFENV